MLCLIILLFISATRLWCLTATRFGDNPALLKRSGGFLLSKGADLVVAACHTVSAFGGRRFKKISVNSVFDVMDSLAEPVLKASNNGRIGIIGTKSTIKSLAHKKKLEEYFPKARLLALLKFGGF